MTTTTPNPMAERTRAERPSLVQGVSLKVGKRGWRESVRESVRENAQTTRVEIPTFMGYRPGVKVHSRTPRDYSHQG